MDERTGGVASRSVGKLTEISEGGGGGGRNGGTKKVPFWIFSSRLLDFGGASLLSVMRKRRGRPAYGG